MRHAVAYFRTSSTSARTTDDDSETRQRRAVQEFAARNDIEIVEEFYDAAVSGADPIDERAGFLAMLKRIANNGVTLILVETANRFARDLMVQETGWARLKKLGIELVAVDSPKAFIEETPTAILIRQILGAVAQFDKAMLVAKLDSGRRRKAEQTGKCGGRKTWEERDPAVVTTVLVMHDRKRSLSQIASALAELGHFSENGTVFSRASIRRIIARARQKADHRAAAQASAA